MAKTKSPKTAKKTKAAKAPQSTLVTFLLDKSYSMKRIKEQTLGGFNAYLDGLKENPDGIEFNFLQFDSESLDKVHVNKPIADVPALTDATFQPRGGTPLIDAAYDTIKAVETAVAGREIKPQVIICIQTDGEENSSKRAWEELSGLIAEKTEAGWQFNFMGAGIDAYNQGARMGIASINTMSYDAQDIGATRMAFAASADNTQAFRTGLRASTAYSGAQRTAAKDDFAHKADDSAHKAGDLAHKAGDFAHKASGVPDLSGGVIHQVQTPARIYRGLTPQPAHVVGLDLSNKDQLDDLVQKARAQADLMQVGDKLVL